MLKLILVDTILDALYFPVWWYSRGLVLALKWAGREIAGVQEFLGIDIWIKNLFRPMYGQRDIAGKIISFFMRLFQIIFRSFVFLGFSLFYCLLFTIYLALPVAVFYGVILHI